MELSGASADLDEPRYFSILVTLQRLLIISSWYIRSKSKFPIYSNSVSRFLMTYSFKKELIVTGPHILIQSVYTESLCVSSQDCKILGGWEFYSSSYS